MKFRIISHSRNQSLEYNLSNALLWYKWIHPMRNYTKVWNEENNNKNNPDVNNTDLFFI